MKLRCPVCQEPGEYSPSLAGLIAPVVLLVLAPWALGQNAPEEIRDRALIAQVRGRGAGTTVATEANVNAEAGKATGENEKSRLGEGPAEKLGWRLAIRCHPKDDLFATVDTARRLGFKYMAIQSDPVKSQELREKIKNKLREAGIKAIYLSVPGTAVNIGHGMALLYPHPDDYYPRLFEFAKELGVEMIEINAPVTADPQRNILSQIYPLCVQYDIKVALRMNNFSSHNWNADMVLAVSKEYSKYIGTCFLADGNAHTNGPTNIDLIRQLKGRLFCVSLQERTKIGAGLPWGSPGGTLDVKGILTELKRDGFSGILCIEDARGRYDDLGLLNQYKKGGHLFNEDNLRESKEYFEKIVGKWDLKK